MEQCGLSDLLKVTTSVPGKAQTTITKCGLNNCTVELPRSKKIILKYPSTLHILSNGRFIENGSTTRLGCKWLTYQGESFINHIFARLI